jgi:hypothetical protein
MERQYRNGRSSVHLSLHIATRVVQKPLIPYRWLNDTSALRAAP